MGRVRVVLGGLDFCKGRTELDWGRVGIVLGSGLWACRIRTLGLQRSHQLHTLHSFGR